MAASSPTRVIDPPIRAFVSFWMQDSDDRASCEAAPASHAAQLLGFLVVESRPLVHVRNEILRTLCGDRSRWIAVVEETFPIKALEDRKVYFDAKTDAELEANNARMKQSARRFIDYSLMEMTHMSEYYLG